MVSGGIMCIPNRFTAPRGSLMACMLPRELRWEEVAPPHKGMTKCLAWAGVILMYHVKHLRNDLVRFIRHYINGLLLLYYYYYLFLYIYLHYWTDEFWAYTHHLKLTHLHYTHTFNCTTPTIRISIQQGTFVQSIQGHGINAAMTQRTWKVNKPKREKRYAHQPEDWTFYTFNIQIK